MNETLDIILKAIDEKKGERIMVYDFNSVSPFIDYTVITSASNLRQVYAIANHIDDCMREHGHSIRRMEGNQDSRWILVDTGSIVAHVFLDEERDHYKLEKLYAGFPLVETNL